LDSISEPAAVRIWALLGARAGDNDQVLALADAIGLPYEIKQLEYNRLNRLGPHLLGRSLASLTSASRATIRSETPPDLTISTGHRSVPVVRALQERSGGRMRSIHVGFPRVSPGNFDLVIVPPQYAAAEHPHLMRIPFALTRAATTDTHMEASSLLSALPGPRRLVAVGGPTLFWNLDESRLLTEINGLLESALSDGGSVMVTSSARTPPGVSSLIDEMLAKSAAPSLFARPRQPPSYASLLGAADSIHVTADSVSMISDAIWSGKPFAVIPVVHSKLGRAAFALNDRVRPGSRVYPQDLRFFWQSLAKIGVGEHLSVPSISAATLFEEVMQRVRPVVHRAAAAALY
jgi:mitochondrial fission protein ELM1